jgi:hypothetical protein
MKRLIILLSLFLCTLAPATALAYNPLDSACNVDGGASSTACQSRSSQTSNGDPAAVLRKITAIVAILAGIAAVIVIIVGGFQYITSAGDPQKASSARSTILGAIIGLVIIVAAQSIILLVLSKI